jgi:hypothetical protein
MLFMHSFSFLVMLEHRINASDDNNNKLYTQCDVTDIIT